MLRHGRSLVAQHVRSCEIRGPGRVPLSARGFATAPHDPLNILFCGSDEFSQYSLRALHTFQQAEPKKIESIELLCRTDKRRGRGLKELYEVPIKKTGRELDLNLYQLDSFKDWTLPSHINLVIAVSFGLLVPARILQQAKYGGLNLHPSPLPDLRGAAPMTHTLLKRRAFTGVTLQTMHPTKFDHGTILARTSSIPVPENCTPEQLLQLLGPTSAQLLIDGLDRRLFLPPHQACLLPPSHPDNTGDSAPKITPEDREIKWQDWDAEEVQLRGRVLGDLWDTSTWRRCFQEKPQAEAHRLTFHAPWEIRDVGRDNDVRVTAGEPRVYRTSPYEESRLAIATRCGRLVLPAAVTIASKKAREGGRALVAALSSKYPEIK